jgi:flagellar protein FliT
MRTNATNCKKQAWGVEIGEWLAAKGNKLKEFSIIFQKILKLALSAPLCRDTRYSDHLKDGATMTSNDVLNMYESLAGLTAKMSLAAQAGDMTSLAALEKQCAIHAKTAEAGVPALSGASRLRKIDLLKQIMANDRAIRDVTEPWMNDVMAVAAH